MWNPFRRKEQRSEPTTIEELLSYMGVNNTGAGEFVSPQTAESLPAVMNAVTVISEAVASMPCYLYALKEDGRERIYRHPVEYLLNECQTAVAAVSPRQEKNLKLAPPFFNSYVKPKPSYK